MSTPQPKPNLPVTLSFDEVDDLIYTARSNDLDALKADIERLSKTYNCSPSSIIRSAIDVEEESEGGTGGCLLHWPAANGYLELLTYLLQTVINASETNIIIITSFINHRNYSGNTALHWAALNTQLDCVKALTEAGADISAKNDSGHDAIFLAEQADWNPVQVGDEGESTSASASASTSTSTSRYEVYGVKVESRARQVVEWLLGCEKAAGLERSSTGSAAVEHEEEEEAGTEEMEGVEAANGIKINK